jgi:adenosylcobinamide-GDP ribazoletransferase
VTGALHEDGLADLSDGLWGGLDPTRRLEIMRDSRIGSYGVIALALSLIARWALLLAALEDGSIAWVMAASGAASRAPLPALMRWLPPARAEGLSRGVGVPPASAIWIGAGIGGATLLPFGPVAAVAAAMAVTAMAYGVGILSHAKLGGQTGDVLGACQQLCEIGALAVLTSR